MYSIEFIFHSFLSKNNIISFLKIYEMHILQNLIDSKWDFQYLPT